MALYCVNLEQYPDWWPLLWVNLTQYLYSGIWESQKDEDNQSGLLSFSLFNPTCESKDPQDQSLLPEGSRLQGEGQDEGEAEVRLILHGKISNTGSLRTRESTDNFISVSSGPMLTFEKEVVVFFNFSNVRTVLRNPENKNSRLVE